MPVSAVPAVLGTPVANRLKLLARSADNIPVAVFSDFSESAQDQGVKKL